MLVELQNQGKHITLYKVLAHMGIKSNEVAIIATKEAIGVPRVGTNRLLLSYMEG